MRRTKLIAAALAGMIAGSPTATLADDGPSRIVDMNNATEAAQWRRDAMHNAVRRTVDAAQRWYGDSSANVFIQNLVVQTISEYFRHEYPELKYANGGLIAFDRSLHPATRNFEWHELGVTGDADFVADDADDIPRADIFGEPNQGRVRTIATHFSYGRDEIELAQLQGNLNIVQEKAEAARLLMDTRLNRTLLRGRPELGFDGLANARGIIFDVANVGGWATATAAQIVDDWRRFVTGMVESTGGIEGYIPDTAVMPFSIYNRLSMLTYGTATDATVLEMLQKFSPWIKRWEWDVAMSTASPAAGRMLTVYKNDRSVVRAVQPRGVRFLPEQERGRRFVVIGEMRYGGLIIPKPRAIGHLTGI